MFWDIWTIAFILRFEKEGEEDHILIIIDERHQKTSKQSKDHDNFKR
jgi:formylmethanofuran dehydrogenase subunit B